MKKWGTVLAVALVVTMILGLIAEMGKKTLDQYREINDQAHHMRVAYDSLNASTQQAATLTTARLDDVQDALDLATRSNQALRHEIERLNGAVTSVSTGQGDIHVGGTHIDTVTTQDFDVRVDDDPWVAFRIRKTGGLLRTDYQTRFSLHETDVEMILPDGAKSHLYDVAIVSDVTGDTLRVPVRRTYVESVAGRRRRFEFRPQVQGGAVWGGDVADPAIGLSVFRMGPRWTLARGDLAIGERLSLGVTPLAFNLGDPLPLLTNLHVGAGLFLAGRTGVYFSAGVIL